MRKVNKAFLRTSIYFLSSLFLLYLCFEKLHRRDKEELQIQDVYGDKKELLLVHEQRMENDMRRGKGGRNPSEEEQKNFKLDLKRSNKWTEEEETITRPSKIDLEAVENRVFELRLRVENTCNQLRMDGVSRAPGALNSWEFMINRQYRLIYCPVFKSASTTWIYNFLLMANLTKRAIKSSKESSPVEMARKYYVRPKEEHLRSLLQDSNYKSLLIVREPFHRLLSAFRDKIESTSQNFYNSLRCRISQYDPKYDSAECAPNFAQFVSFVIAEEKAGKKPNEHWAPVFLFCSPCEAHFDFVLKFEALAEEEAFLVSQIPELSGVLEAHKLHSSHTNYDEVAKRYYSNLTREALDGLLRIYRRDFDLFGYEYFEYLQMVVEK